MYLREVISKRKRGPDVTYVQLCESEWDAKKGSARTRILHSFGRKDELDLRQMARLAEQLRLPGGGRRRPGLGGIDLTDTWDFGGPHLLDGLWRELQLDAYFGEALRARRFEAPVERALLAMVAQRALAPDSKLAGSRWAGGRAWIPGLERGGEELEVQHFYRAMDFLAEAMDELRGHLYLQVTDLLNADVSVLFYDTTSVSFQLPVPDGAEGLRRLGKSKKKRADLPQVVLGLAINRDGLPVRHWVFPGNTVDVTTVEGVVDDLLGLRPRRFLFIGDRGMVSQENLDFLESRRLHYLLGSKLREGGVVQSEVLSLRGRYGKITDTLGVKETRVTDGGREVRYLLCRDTERAHEDRAVRREIVARLEEELEGSRTAEAHTRKACRLLSRRGYARYLRETDRGGLEIDRARVRADERLDGKYVLMTNELDLPAQELVLGYRDMWRAERAFRSMKSVLRIEPVHHRAERRIVAHAHLCCSRICSSASSRTGRARAGRSFGKRSSEFRRPASRRITQRYSGSSGSAIPKAKFGIPAGSRRRPKRSKSRRSSPFRRSRPQLGPRTRPIPKGLLSRCASTRSPVISFSSACWRGFPIQPIQTDRGGDFFALTLQKAVKHPRIKNRPVRPHPPHT